MKPGILVIFCGVVLSFIAAVVPHFSGAYQLLVGVLLAHLTPYLVYAPAVLRLDDRAVDVAGVLLLLTHGGLVTLERFVNMGEYTGPAVYVVPLLAALLLSPLFHRAARAPWLSK